MRGLRTDLAMESVGEESGRLEGVSMSAHQIGGVKRTRIVIQSRRAAEVLQRPVGEYITLECPELSRCGQPERQMLIRLIAQAVRALLPKEGEVLVVGLGNRNVTADALGTRVVERTLVTRHLGESLAREMRGRLRGVSTIAPGVLGLTGIETAELCRGLIQRVRPAAVVAIDARRRPVWPAGCRVRRIRRGCGCGSCGSHYLKNGWRCGVVTAPARWPVIIKITAL